MRSESQNTALGVKITALLLAGGGLLGLASVPIALVAFPQQLLSQPPLKVAFGGFYLFLDGWCTWIGFDLWRGKSHALKWARIIFALQIPYVTVPGFSYLFQTAGVTVQLFFSSHGYNLKLGSYISIFVSPLIEGYAFGVNIVAIAALIYLTRLQSLTYEMKKDSRLGLI